MTNPTTFYVTGVHDGLVLTQQDRDDGSRPVMEHWGEHDTEQKWTVEQGDEPDVIALKSVANGKYLHCPEIRIRGAIVLSDEKRWWRISKDNVTPFGAWSLRPVDSPPNLCLNLRDPEVKKGSPSELILFEWYVSVLRNIRCCIPKR